MQAMRVRRCGASRAHIKVYNALSIRLPRSEQSLLIQNIGSSEMERRAGRMGRPSSAPLQRLRRAPGSLESSPRGGHFAVNMCCLRIRGPAFARCEVSPMRPVGACKDKEHRPRPPVRLSAPGHRKTLRPPTARIVRQLRRYACHIFVDRPLRVSTRYFRQNIALLRAKGGRRSRSRCGHLVHSNTRARQELGSSHVKTPSQANF